MKYKAMRPSTPSKNLFHSAKLILDESLKFRYDRLYPLSKYKYINDEMVRRGEKTILTYISSIIHTSQQDEAEK